MKYTDLAVKLIEDINSKFDSAYSDIISATGDLENSLKQIIPELSLKIKVASEGMAGSILSLTLDPNTEDNGVQLIRIADFYIPSNGYPISHGSFKHTEDFAREADLFSKQDIEKLFESMMSSGESRIIQSIGYAARRKKLRASF